MSEIDLLQRIQELKDEEEKQISEMRLKRHSEQEATKKELEKRNEEEELKNLMIEETKLKKKLSEVRKTVFQMKMEAVSWENLAKSKTKELRNLEKTLNECYMKIWTNRENFCDRIDNLLKDHNVFKNIRIPETVDNKTEEDIRKLSEAIVVEEELDKAYTKTLTELEEEKEKLKQVPNSAEYKRLEEWIQITRDRCTELNRRIHEKRILTDAEKNAKDNKLFSIVNLEDVKKMTRNWK